MPKTAELDRLKQLVGPSWTVKQDGKEFVVAPVDVNVRIKMSKKDFALGDDQLVERILTPAINNLQAYLDQERPYHKNRQQLFFDDVEKLGALYGKKTAGKMLGVD